MPNPRLLLVLALALSLAACGTSVPSSGTSAVPESATPAVAATTEPPAETGAPVGTEEVPTEDPVETEPVETEPTESVDPSSSPDASGAPAVTCSGIDANPDFFRSATIAVDWTVLCASLPKGWYVSAGSYRLANGGKLVIGYKGPDGATLALSEGAFCTDGTGCVPAGTDGEDVPLGPLTGTLVRLDAGGFAIVVDRGSNPSWLLQSNGLDEATTLAFGAALLEVTVTE
ncbi:MAG: hypothetical protein Q8M74_01390 [Chloroflexota bacterium]|nr:hypothetical protein [Chloroflexota bacterium]